ncbi:hypothetical protein [Leifsonia sp. TF02-11]|uniref:hypothetical protein n=1 Tax=Leifsonia sp. TF02-11 TaxID=2815212 RepID=UPI001AA1C850|nr:hypothetical protein [Leifsonia sp. TF02-11]MBO1739699.1 hypothetical protein [Leifsonia sp. TF02-11]
MTEKALVAYSDASLSERQRYAQTLAAGGDLIPKGLWAQVRQPDGAVLNQPSPGKVLLVMETGDMLGIHPVAAMQGVHIIEGKATLSPALMSAVVRKAGHRLRVRTTGSIAAGDFAATASLTRSDDPEFTYEATWTPERATRAGLMGKDVWKKYAEAMCKARAISEVCREGAEDALMGVHYTPEELDLPVREDGAADPDVIEGELEPTEDWPTLIEAAQTKDAVTDIVNRAKAAGEFTDPVRTLALARYGSIGRAEERAEPKGDAATEPEAAEEVVEPTEDDYEQQAGDEYAAAVERGEVQP